MITTTSLQSPRLLAAIKQAVVQAITLAHSRACPSAAKWVENRRGEPCMYAQASRGKPVQLFDLNGRNVTDLVMSALRAWHREAV